MNLLWVLRCRKSLSRLVMRNAFSLTLGQFGGHVFSLVARASILFEEIWEEEHLQYSEHDKELDANHEPQRPPKCHRAEALVVEVEGASKEAFRVHNRHKDRYFVARAKLFRYFINEKERKGTYSWHSPKEWIF